MKHVDDGTPCWAACCCPFLDGDSSAGDDASPATSEVNSETKLATSAAAAIAAAAKAAADKIRADNEARKAAAATLALKTKNDLAAAKATADKIRERKAKDAAAKAAAAKAAVVKAARLPAKLATSAPATGQTATATITTTHPATPASKTIPCAAKNCDLAPPWRPPAEGYCYKKGNDWSACAGDHMLYPPSAKADILKRAVAGEMCLREPLCWKQLDWRTTDPPESSWTCRPRQSLRLYELSNHDGSAAAASSFIEKSVNELSVPGTRHEVFLCNAKRSGDTLRNYNPYPFKQCTFTPAFVNVLEDGWKTSASTSRAVNTFNAFKGDAHFREADGLMFSFSPSSWEHWMGFNKTMILHLSHRVNMYRCGNAESTKTFTNLRRLAQSGPGGELTNGPRHIIGAGFIYDGEYIRHYTGVRPILLGFTVADALRPLSSANPATPTTESCYADYTTGPLSLSSICCGQAGAHNPLDLRPAKACPSWRRRCTGYRAGQQMGVCGASEADTAYDIATPLSTATQNTTLRREILWNGRKVPTELTLKPGMGKAPWDGKPFHFVKATWKGRYKTRDLAKYRAVVYVPYSVSNVKSAEQRALNLPIFVPDPAFAVQFSDDRTQTYAPYCPGFTDSQHPGAHADSPYEFSPNVQTGKAAEFWLAFSIIYQWPCTKTFSSWAHLIELLETTDLAEMRQCNEQANKWFRFELAQNWCWAFGQMGTVKRDFPSRYGEATQELYGTTAIPR